MSSRYVVAYRSPNGVHLRGAPEVALSGFRIFGHHLRRPGSVLPLVRRYADVSTDLGAGLTSTTVPNWYAAFAVANSGATTADIRVMPYIRVRTVSGSSVTFNNGGEAVHAASAQTYPWAANALNGADCLVISETPASDAVWSGRVTTVTANTSSQLTLSTVGNIGPHDWLLVAPPGFGEYHYLGSFYMEPSGAAVEPRNIADDGREVASYGVYFSQPNINSALPSPTKVQPLGYICPLATTCIVRFTNTLSTSSTGAYAAYFDHDGSNHVIAQTYVAKYNSSNLTQVDEQLRVPMSQGPRFYVSNAGSLVGTGIGDFRPIGWVEA